MRPLATVALALLLLTGLAAPPAAAGWRWPVRGPLLARFHYRPARPFARGQRRGIDVAAARGAPVVAACAGRVRFAGAVGTSGRTVSMACGPYVVSYLHLGALATRRGARLAAGDGIGTVGTTGRPRERRAHLSFGVRRASDRWAYVDPLRLLPGGEIAPPEVAPTMRRRSTPPRPDPDRGPAVAPPLGPAPGSAPARGPTRARPARAPAVAGVHASPRPRGAFGLPLGSLWLPAGAALALAAITAPLVRHARRGARAGARQPPARTGAARPRLTLRRTPAGP